jgi:hypothetical protein
VEEAKREIEALLGAPRLRHDHARAEGRVRRRSAASGGDESDGRGVRHDSVGIEADEDVEQWLAREVETGSEGGEGDVAVIVSQAMPKGVKQFELIDGVYVVSPQCVRPVAGMVVSLRGGQAIYVTFLSPPQSIDSPEFAEIPQKCRAWKTLER